MFKLTKRVLNQILNYQYKLAAKFYYINQWIKTYCIDVNLESKQATSTKFLLELVNN